MMFAQVRMLRSLLGLVLILVALFPTSPGILPAAMAGPQPDQASWISMADSMLPDPGQTYQTTGTHNVTPEATNCDGDGQDTRTSTPLLGAEVIVQPPALEASLAPDETASATLWINNNGSVDLDWELHELAPPLADQVGTISRPRANPVVDPDLERQVAAGGHAQAIITLRELPDLSPAYTMADLEARRRFVFEQLQATADRTGGRLLAWLQAAGAEPRQLAIVNGIAATLDARLLEEVSARPEVAEVRPVRVQTVMRGIPASAGQLGAAPATAEWNIAKIRADEAWSELGITGEGAVVGEIDTGVMYDHTALVNQYRGNLGGGIFFDHDYNWYDLSGGLPFPYDDHGHGTFGMGLAVGDDGGTNQIGVAPGAKWIAVKACSGGGSCTDADLIAAGQWMLAPTRVDGTDPDTSKAPDLVFNMWGSGGYCDSWYQVILWAWRAANILPIFSPGAYGAGCCTIASPAALPEAFSAGATDSNDLIASFSGRGPSPCGGVIKPEVAAPGVNVRSSNNEGGYWVESGTSWSAAHLAGAAALVISADPSLSINAAIEIITSSALCIEDLSCGGTPCPDGANNVYGWGRIDAYEAVSLTLAGADVLPWLVESPVSGTLAPDEGAPVAVTFDAAGLEPGVYAGQLDIESNDPTSPHVIVPVTMTVYPPCDPVDISGVTIDASGCIVAFGAQVSGTAPISYTWDFGPFGVFAEPDPVVDFGATGTYTGTLEASNCGGAGHDAYAVTVDVECAAPCQAVDILGVTTETDGCSVTFTAEVTGTPPLSYTWDFGEFGFSTEPMPVVDFGWSGTYSASLSIANCLGTGTDSEAVTVELDCTWLLYVPVIVKNGQ